LIKEQKHHNGGAGIFKTWCCGTRSVAQWSSIAWLGENILPSAVSQSEKVMFCTIPNTFMTFLERQNKGDSSNLKNLKISACQRQERTDKVKHRRLSGQ
jgi:hypothetical protein